MAHSPRWISLEEYYALGDGTITPEQIRAGVTVAEARSGQVLESKAGPQTLEQKDFQGNAIIHDILTQGGLTETETSDKTTRYGAVNSTITERAPTISKTYQQNQSYSESYQTKTETINAQTYTRDIQSPQYTKTQNNLNLSVPNNLNVNATQSITRSINTRNATIGTHTMSGENYNFTGNTIQRFGNITIIRGDFVTLRANSFKLNAGPMDAAPQPVQPRRAPPNMIAKVSGTFGSKTITLPTAYDANYMVQVAFTVSGDYEMESLNSMNPTSISQEGIETEMTKVIGDYFYGMQLTHANDQGLDDGITPTFIMGNQYGNYTLTNGIKLGPYNPYVFTLKYSTSLSQEKKLVDEWQVTLTGTLESIITVAKRTTFDNLEIRANNLVIETQNFLATHKNDPRYGAIILGLQTYARPVINSMYKQAEFLSAITIRALAFE